VGASKEKEIGQENIQLWWCHFWDYMDASKQLSTQHLYFSK